MAEKSERLKIIETVIDDNLGYQIKTDEENTDIVADNMPDGELFKAKNIEDSTFRKYLFGLSKERGRIQAQIKIDYDEKYIWKTVDGIREHELSVSIPDSCFKIENKTLDRRRRQVLAKESLMYAHSRQDYIDFAKLFEVDIEITNGANHAPFPATFPIFFQDSLKSAKYTMIVFVYEEPISSFPYQFPIVFTEGKNEFIKCAIKKMVPANIATIFHSISI